MNMASSYFLQWILMGIVLLQSDSFKIVSIVDESYEDAPAWIEQALASSEAAINRTLTNTMIRVSIMDESSAEQQFCQAINKGISLVMDLTGGRWTYGQSKAEAFGIPYVHLQISVYLWMKSVDQLLRNRNATDAALIFSNEALLDQALYYLVEGSVVRVIVLSGIESDSIAKLKRLRPAPSHYIMFGPASDLSTMFSKAISNDLVTRDSQWTIVITTPGTVFTTTNLPGKTMLTIVNTTESLCCIATKKDSPCSCDSINVNQEFIKNGMETSLRTLKELNPTDKQVNCVQEEPEQQQSINDFSVAMEVRLNSWTGMKWMSDKQQMIPMLSLNIESKNSTMTVNIGSWNADSGLEVKSDIRIAPVKRFMKIGTIVARPWFYIDPRDRTPVSENEYIGYCVELTKKLAEQMNFDYEFVLPSDNKYGAKNKNGTWNGMVGDLARGETDIIVAPITMTSEREEVIDFVAPYFDQSGISIVIRKRERQENLFKFMTVLKAEVWVSIVAALVVTGIMIWFLDKYSPYSAQNNPDLQNQSFRKFTLKESFWFALTSFTPQGGGEAPKALSGRTLVAAYWLFVVLMLATFTANLAAFLTVERMQSPVQSLEALAKQAKIAFTTEKDTSMYEYFNNMAQAEEELFRVWKQLTLNSTSDQSKYRVWDYPIKEQYTHIKQIIDKTGPVSSAQEGLDKVLASELGEFALIHDAAELRYEVYQNCKLAQIGEPFAEQPYAIAVQQGSHLQDEISRTILQMQKNRYFEALTARFWNSSARGDCPNESDSEGITLQSLGGVFIATLVGLILALIALAAEVMYYRQVPEIPKSISGTKIQQLKNQGKHTSRISVSPAF